MEYAKDEIFSIQYNKEKDTLEYGNRTSFLGGLLKKNKWFRVILIITLVLSISNIVCIYNFYTLLSSL